MKNIFWFKFLLVLKAWSRAGLLDIVIGTLNERMYSKVLSIGGYGPVDEFLEPYVVKGSGIYTTLDIEKKHSPEVLGDVREVEKFFSPRTFDAVIALEVLEHVSDPELAINGIFKILKNKQKWF